MVIFHLIFLGYINVEKYVNIVCYLIGDYYLQEEEWNKDTISPESELLLGGRTPLHIACARDDNYKVGYQCIHVFPLSYWCILVFSLSLNGSPQIFKILHFIT